MKVGKVDRKGLAVLFDSVSGSGNSMGWNVAFCFANFETQRSVVSEGPESMVIEK